MGRGDRREENQRLFRMGNQLIDEATDGRVPDNAEIPFLCECADESCSGRVELPRAQWASVTAKHNHFVIVAGHPRSEGEVVVAKEEAYDVVRKPG